MQKYIANTDILVLERTFSDALEAGEYLRNHPVDLMFLDINLPLLSGMDFLRSSVKLPLTILTTAYSEFALESYRYSVVDYLLKPISFERFSQAIEKVLTLTHTLHQLGAGSEASSGKHVYIRCSHDLVKVKSGEIIFIASSGDYTEVVTATQKYLTVDSLKEWTGKLDRDFFQVHKSFIVNVTHILKISSNKIHLVKDHVIPIGRVFKRGFMGSMEGGRR